MDDYDYGYDSGYEDANSAADRYIEKLEEMYRKDTNELRSKLEEVTRDRDNWKEKFETMSHLKSATNAQQLRHV